MEYDDIQRLFGRRVKGLRKKAGLSQAGLAEKISKSTDTVSNIERGFASTRIKTVARIAASLDVPLKELFDLQPTSAEATARALMTERMVDLLQSCNKAQQEGAVEILEVFIRTTSTNRKDSISTRPVKRRD